MFNSRTAERVTRVLPSNQIISSFFSFLEGLDPNCLRSRSPSPSWRKTRRRRTRKGWSFPRCRCYCLQTRMRSWRSRCCLRKSRRKSLTNHCCRSWKRTSKKTADQHIKSCVSTFNLCLFLTGGTDRVRQCEEQQPEI